MDQIQPWTNRVYRLLLRLLPFDFRSDFGRDMERTFQDQAASVAKHEGRAGLLRLWAETIAGIFRVAPGEHWQMLKQDTAYALRMMRKNLGYTAVAAITLALGVGMNTAIFSVIDGTLLRPLPYLQGDRLVVVRQEAPKLASGEHFYSVAEVNDYRQQNHTLDGLVEYHNMPFTLFSHGDAVRVQTGVVSANFFDVFGVRPLFGRNFVASDEEPSAPPVLILSYEFWKSYERRDPNVVGETFEMNDRVHTVIGVLPPVPQYPDQNDVYMPTTSCPTRSSPQFIANRGGHMMRAFGKLKPGTSMAQAQADLATVAAQLQQQYPKFYPADSGYTAEPVSLQKELTKQARPTLLVLLAAAGFVLLIACANVANFSLARVSQRERELLVRAALGAGRGRLLRQLITESALMGILAGALGLLLASASLKLLVEFAARLTPRAREITINGPVLLFALLAAVGTAILSGSVLAFSSREQLATGLKEGATQATAASSRKRVRNALIVLQVAFSFVLLIEAGLMLRSFVKLQEVDPGFAPQRVLTTGINLNWSKYDRSKRREAARTILENVQSLPGVLSAAVSSSFPLDPDSIAMGPMQSNFQIKGQAIREGQPLPQIAVRAGSVDYFKTLGIPLIQGRTFTAADTEHALQVADINQSVARHRFAGVDPIGKTISFDGGKTWITIVGIVGDTREFGLDQKPDDEIYVPLEQAPAVGSLLVRTAGQPATLIDQVRRAVRGFDPQTALTNVETLEEARSDTLTPPRLMTNLLGLFALLALLIAATGIGGILALSVNQRVHEIGIRLALGAESGDVLKMVIRQGMILVLVGLGLGLLGSFWMTSPLRSLLFEVTPTDSFTFLGVAAVLAVAAFVACYIPARRATRIDPLVALRYE